MQKAKEMIEKKKINHLLVVDKKGDLIGIVSDRDVKQSWASPATALKNKQGKRIRRRPLMPTAAI